MTYCEAFLLMEVSPLWAVLFFMMLVLLGIDSEFGTLEGAVAPLYDLKWVTMRKEIFMGKKLLQNRILHVKYQMEMISSDLFLAVMLYVLCPYVELNNKYMV